MQNLVRLEIGDALEMIGCKQDDARCGYRRPLDGCAGVGMSIFDKRLTNVFTWGIYPWTKHMIMYSSLIPYDYIVVIVIENGNLFRCVPSDSQDIISDPCYGFHLKDSSLRLVT